MKISDTTNVQMPMKTVASLVTLVAVGTWAYFGLIQRITELETAKQLMEADLLKKAEQTPVDMEQSMILEWLGTKNATMEAELESMMNSLRKTTGLKDII